MRVYFLREKVRQEDLIYKSIPVKGRVGRISWKVIKRR